HEEPEHMMILRRASRRQVHVRRVAGVSSTREQVAVLALEGAPGEVRFESLQHLAPWSDLRARAAAGLHETARPFGLVVACIAGQDPARVIAMDDGEQILGAVRHPFTLAPSNL